MPETLSPGQGEQEASEPHEGEKTAKQLLDLSRRELNQISSEMSTNKEDLLVQEKELKKDLEFALKAGDQVTANNIRFGLDAIKHQLDVRALEEEQKAD